jgi:hypothetical protein
MKAFAIAIHIPVALWALTGYLIASQIFNFDPVRAAGVAAICALLIYLVERLVLATPKTWYVNLGRILIGFVIALLGASAVDLVIFNREVSLQLQEAGETKIKAEFDKAIATQQVAANQSKIDWFNAQEAANCEANGTCGSKIRNVGPVYRELSRHAEFLRKQYIAAQAKLDHLAMKKTDALEDWRSTSRATDQAGLLARIEALHHYTTNNCVALATWLLFFSLVLFFELMVVLVKLVFDETVDDKIEGIREQLSQYKASAFLEAATSPVANVRQLLHTPC